MPFVTSSDVAQLQADIKAEADGLSDAVKNCIFAGTLSPNDATVTQWISMRARVDAFLGQDPSTLRAAAQMDAGQQIQRDLVPWHARLQQKGCADVPPAPSPPPAPQDLFGNLKDIGVILLIFFAMREFGR